MQRKKHRLVAAYNVTRGTIIPMCEEMKQRIIEDGQEATPLLSEQELFAELRETARYLPVAADMMRQGSPGAYQNFQQEHLHHIGHILAMALMLRYRQPLRSFDDNEKILCDLLSKLGV